MRIALFPALLTFIITCFSGCSSSDKQPYSYPSQNISGQLPHLITNKTDDALYLSWVEKIDDSTYFYFSEWSTDRWSDPILISKGTDWFVNWADYPMISVNQSGAMQAHYLQKSSSGTYSYNVKLVQSENGVDWIELGAIHNDGTPTEHGFVSHIVRPDSTYQVAWLDGRQTNASHEGHSHGGGAMTLRTALVDPNGKISERTELDNRTCDCCQTTGTWTDQGAVIAYRDRSDLEIRDIYVVRQTPEGWSEPKPVWNDGWQIEGCPVNGPRITSKGNQVAIAWYTAAQNKPTVKVSFSQDAGENFGEPVVLDSDNPIGRVDIVSLDENRVAVSWLAGDGSIQLAIYDQLKGLVSKQGIASSSIERSAGFPQLEKLNQSLLLAWTVSDSLGYSIRTQQIPL